MKQSTMEAYAEVDMILNLMDEKYVREIPEKLRTLFKSKKAKDYSKNIVDNKPLKEQNLNKETLSILAVLNYNYWCKDEKRKKELWDIYSENDRKYQQELREKYSPDDILKKDNSPKYHKDISKEDTIIEYKESIFKRIINKIKSIFHINKGLSD